MAATHREHHAARVGLRLTTQKLLRQMDDPQVHMTRVQAALLLDGAEPVQGALADVFCRFSASHTSLKRAVLQASGMRLPEHTRRAFENLIDQEAIPSITPLATRWSVLATPSADIPARARRCSADDSRKLAQQGAAAFLAQDAQAQDEFLQHCATCHDKLAFMLARRTVLEHAPSLPQAWLEVSEQLERLQGLA